MDPSERQRFKSIIQKQIQQVTEDIERYKELAKPISPDNAIGRVSRMEAISEKSVNDANLRKAQARSQALAKALIRVETEDFGICLRCEEYIAHKRLEILPESQVCMNCLNRPPEP